ncbi:FAD-binding protein [Rhodopseudomonas palustris]|uniref:FAD-binding protein n=1 Tax=Thiospirillum jenense TaxID=1653858 RepID=A0A839H7R5_9GAMM|nr:FAD-linked oxidase C-terminal domain-containing protein [Thiospirillum jenense]MBB1089660.1 FAD-binding protein [Rhodopseudomonas palustris]MBB1124760.1 FAD-binding protein [Thiospirillum jenense]
MSTHPQLSTPHRCALIEIVGADNLLTNAADRWCYGYDNSRRQGVPLAVAFVTSTAQVQQLLSYCHAERLPVTARGAGTGTTGATVPESDGIVIAFQRMNQIITIDPANRLARVQPGVINAQLQQAVGLYGFFWPPDPTSSAVCTIGGNLAHNSAGPRAVKYGTPRDNTLGLTAVTGDGTVIRTGVMTTKGVVGYDLTRLMIGSEGTLALITEATLKLTPAPAARRTIQITYADIHAAAAAVAAIMAQPITPCALEFMDAAAIAMVREYSDLGIGAEVGALLMVEVDGAVECVDGAAAAVTAAAQVAGMLVARVATTADEVAALWKTRKALSPALRHVAPKKINEDVVVPVAQMAQFVERLAALGREWGIRIVTFGHAGNGNIHVNVLPAAEYEFARARECVSAIFNTVIELGGTLSGEHGVGIEKREFIDRELTPAAVEMMWKIKQQFDPRGILNCGKTLPMSEEMR